MMKNVTVIDAPIVQDALVHLRNKETDLKAFRFYADRISLHLLSHSLGVSDLIETQIETALEKTKGKIIAGNFVVIPILRAGLAMLPSSLELIPQAKVGFAGLVRDEKTAVAREYYWKMPPITDKNKILIVDPMIATGGSIVHVLRKLSEQKQNQVRIVSIVAAPQGIKKIHDTFADVNIFTASVDRRLNKQKYIVPGLGDFGDRYFGTD